MVRKILLCCIILVFFIPSINFAGSFGKDDPSGTPGNWYVGTSPSSVDNGKHPILFVHGLNSSSSTWWEENNMYDTAYEAGYETSFIDLYPSKNMWDNGSLLAQKIKSISNHFGERVVLVAHSKGGVDAQSAIVHYGAAPYVAKVITLSSPHHGSELADLAYSSWAGWLAGIIGSKSDATYSLQTGYMEYFRSQTDHKSNVHQVPIYTFGGTDIGSFGSSLYWGGLYLNSYGENDGAVTVESSRLPYATEIKVDAWDHSSIKEGTSTFSLFDNYLNEGVYSLASSLKMNPIGTVNTEDNGISTIIRGGEVEKEKTESFRIEKGVKEITVDWISNQKEAKLTLINPKQQTSTPITTMKDNTAFFNGAYHHSVTITKPSSGTWKVHARNKQKYLLHVSLDSPLNDKIDFSLNRDKSLFKAQAKDDSVHLTTKATVEFYKNGKQKKGKVQMKKNGTLHMPKLGEGVYNITVEINGKDENGAFERTKIKTVYVDENGKMYE
ncbi:lipase family alpha/beta hydrolase [Radiobacillus deserti]|nr:hypothetical protein [Radiobacillus deserti]